MQEILIEPNKRPRQTWPELWQYRDFLFFLARRNLLVLHKQTAIGISWIIIRPLLTMILFYIIFSKVAKLPSFGAPYPLLVYAAILPWQFFSQTISESSNSLITDSHLITKVYFPRLIIPTCSILVGLTDLGVSLILFLIFMPFFQVMPTFRLFLLPLMVILVSVLTLGTGYFLSALTTRFRDFRHAIPILMQFGLFISPIGYSSQVIPEPWRMIYYLNPIAGIVEGFRWALLGTYSLNVPAVAIAACLCPAIFIFGLLFFTHNERKFADFL